MFNQGEFYACHDILEALWIEAGEPQKSFYQGILQIAVACYHLGNQNWRGAVILLGEGIRRLEPYQPAYAGLNVTQLLELSHNLLIHLQQAGPAQVETFSQLVLARTQPPLAPEAAPAVERVEGVTLPTLVQDPEA